MILRIVNHLYYLHYSTLKDHPRRDAKSAALELPAIVFTCFSIVIGNLLYTRLYLYYTGNLEKLHIALIFGLNILLAILLFNVLYKRTSFYQNIEEYYQLKGKVSYAFLKSAGLLFGSVMLGLVCIIAIGFWGHQFVR